MVTSPTSAAYFATPEPYLKQNHRIALRSEIVTELVGRPEGKRILDLGCGNGAVSLPLAVRNSVILVDNSAAMLNEARRFAEALRLRSYELHQADANDVNIEPVDVILALGLLAHVDDTS